MITRIISAFPGTGKSYFHNNSSYSTLDSDSSEFSWVVDGNGNKVRNPEFPSNYIKHIKDNIGKVDFIFVSSHKDVRTALKEECIFFYLIYPCVDDKSIYLKRYKDRGSPQSFIDLVSNNWDSWVKECSFEEYGCKNIRMISGWTISKEISHIVASEHGDVKE